MNYLIVGGSSGIGEQITLQLLNQGHRVVVLSREKRNLPDNPNLHFYTIDITSDNIEFPKLDFPLNGLVYCPGSINLKPFRSISEQDFLTEYIINFLGAVKSIKAYYNDLRKSENPSSIVLFSTVAVQTGMPFHASISSAKGAVEGLTRSLAAEFAPKIRVNAIAPSLTDTPLAEKLLANDDKRKASAERHPLKKVGSAEEVAKAATFLLSEDSSWISGQIIHIDGGMSSLRLL
jgi:NAD(P)-dependent dehydrogenase (short-subunit alcohol dehydrogenase family)